MREDDFFTRHTTRPKEGNPESAEFEGVSKKGVKLTKEEVRDY